MVSTPGPRPLTEDEVKFVRAIVEIAAPRFINQISRYVRGERLIFLARACERYGMVHSQLKEAGAPEVITSEAAMVSDALEHLLCSLAIDQGIVSAPKS